VSLYVYGIAGTSPPEDLGPGLAGEPLRRIGNGAVCAVAGEMDEPPRPEPAALTAQDAVVRRLAESLPALLPARFGQWLPDEQAVAGWLAAHGPELAEALALVAGCVQMTLRVFREPGDPEVPMPADPPELEAAAGPGTRYLAQRRREAERERSLPEIAPLREALRPLLKAERIERPASPGRLHATAYDLIARGADGGYTRLVAEAAPALPGWHVTASGPWPPYAFAPVPVR
jgi:Gas vesicle synthesis protein GvpL/GvpF